MPLVALASFNIILSNISRLECRLRSLLFRLSSQRTRRSGRQHLNPKHQLPTLQLTRPNQRGHTSLAPLIIPCSLSICTYCCSSANANAQGTPSKNALVLMTQSDLPPKDTVERVIEERVDTVLAMRRREEGGMMSLRAMMRSSRDSSSRVVYESVEISDSGVQMLVFSGWNEIIETRGKGADAPVSVKSSSSSSLRRASCLEGAGFSLKCSSSTSVSLTIASVYEVPS